MEFLLLIRCWGEEKSIIAAILFVIAWQDNGFNGVPLFQCVIPVRGNANEKGQKMACIHFLIWNVNVLLKIYHWRRESNSFMKCRLTAQSIFWETDLYTGNAVWEQQASAVLSSLELYGMVSQLNRNLQTYREVQKLRLNIICDLNTFFFLLY